MDEEQEGLDFENEYEEAYSLDAIPEEKVDERDFYDEYIDNEVFALNNYR